MSARQEARRVVIDEILEVLVANTGSPTLKLSQDQSIEMALTLVGAALEVLRRAGVTREEVRRCLGMALGAYPADVLAGMPAKGGRA